MLLLNIVFLYRPPLQSKKSSIKDYVFDTKDRIWAMIAGACVILADWCVASSGQAAGYAFANITQV